MFHKHNNVIMNVSLFFFSASMCTSPQTTSETGRTVWRCNILLLSYVFCKQPLDSLICCHVNLSSILNIFVLFPRYFDNKVFVSLANGEVIVYQREAGEHKGDSLKRNIPLEPIWVIYKKSLSSFRITGSFWDPQSSQTLCLGSPSGPVTKMVPVAGKLWCGCQNRVLIINTGSLTQEVRPKLHADDIWIFINIIDSAALTPSDENQILI